MAFTYDPSDLTLDTASGRLNSTRLLSGDITSSSAKLQDEEINFFLSQANDNVYLAGSYACSAIAAKLADLVNTEVDGQLREDMSDLYRHYLKVSTQLKQLASTVSGLGLSIKAGGISKTTVNNNRQDPDRIIPAFYLEQFEGKYSDLYCFVGED